LKPLPFARSGELFNVFEVQSSEGITGTGWSFANFEALRERNHVFAEMAGSQQHQLTLTGRFEPTVANTSIVTPELFSLFGEAPLAGRVFDADDGKVGAAPVVILSEGLWRSAFRADPTIVGTAINLDKRAFTIVASCPRPSAFRSSRRTSNCVPSRRIRSSGAGWIAEGGIGCRSPDD